MFSPQNNPCSTLLARASQLAAKEGFAQRVCTWRLAPVPSTCPLPCLNLTPDVGFPDHFQILSNAKIPCI